jgi:hypothetical protein
LLSFFFTSRVISGKIDKQGKVGINCWPENEMDALLAWIRCASAKANSCIALDVIFFPFPYSYIPSVQNFECKGEMIIHLLLCHYKPQGPHWARPSYGFSDSIHARLAQLKYTLGTPVTEMCHTEWRKTLVTVRREVRVELLVTAKIYLQLFPEASSCYLLPPR